MINAHPSTLEGVEAARCDALKCGGTYADFVPLIPRDAGKNQFRQREYGMQWGESDAPKDGSRPVVPFTIPFDILEENVFLCFRFLREGVFYKPR